MRARMRKELVEHIPTEPGSFDLIVISAIPSDKNRLLVGKNLAEIGELWKIEPVDAMLRLLEEEQGNVSIVGHGMSPENVRMVLSHPLVMIGSDGLTMAPRGKLGQTRPHPRSYGTCPRVLGFYSREQKLFDLPTAMKKMTSMPANQIGIDNRGRIAKSMKADLVVFNAKTVKDLATFEEPHRYPQGIDYVIVNGVITVDHGKHTGARSGSVLRG
jgi:N-acyl-D-amino-acid deacylase